MAVLSRVFRIRRGEGRVVALVVAAMFSSVAGMTFGESGIGALFFDRVGPDALPVMYLAQGGVGVVAMLLLSAVLGRFERRRAYVWLPLVLLLVVVVERGIVAVDPAWIYSVLWLTTTLGTLVQAVYLWGTAGVVTDTRQAKRLFPLFGAGNILGAVVGGLATPPLATAIGAENLLVLWVVGLAVSSILCATVLGVRKAGRTVRSGSRRRSPIAELREGFAFVRRSRLLVWMSVASVLFSVLFFSLYLPYAQAASDRFPDPDELAGFFGIFWACVTAAAFAVSLLLTNRLLAWVGAAALVLVLPLLYVGAFGVLFVTSTFATLVAIRFAVNVWLQGVSSPGWETLTNVAPEDRRDQVRAFLNGGPTQIGTAIAGVIAIVGERALSPRQLATIGLAAAVVTVVLAWEIRRSYTAALVDAIRAGRPQVFGVPVHESPVSIRGDAQVVALAAAELAGEDPRMRRLAAHLLSEADDPRAVEALRVALRDPDALVRAEAVGALGRNGRLGVDEARRATDDDDARVRLASVRALPGATLPADLLGDEDRAVAAAAAVALLDGPSHAEAERALLRLLGEDAETRARTLHELGEAPAGTVSRFVPPHVDDPSPPVRAAALEALAAAGAGTGVPAALRGLTSDEPVVADAALRTLARLDLRGFEGDVARVVEERSALAVRDGATASSIAPDGEAIDLLRDALLARARTNALVALAAGSVGSGDRDAVRVALEILRVGDRSQLANALEAVETAVGGERARALLALWEPAPGSRDAPSASMDRASSLEAVARDPDPFIRACAELARTERGGDHMTRSVRSMSPVELVIVLRRVPLFAELAPADLERLTAIAEEASYADGDTIGVEGELGDELHIVLEGSVRVVRADVGAIAHRGAGDVVGEMSLITRAPRVASLVAEGDVRTVRIGHRSFEGMLRERPDIALAVMRVLAERLAAMSGGSAGEPG